MADGPKSTMSLMERFDFLSWPLLLLCWCIMFMTTSILCIIVIILKYTYHRSQDRSDYLMMAFCIILSLLLLRYLYNFFYKMILRKRNTGIYFLSGEELKAFRLRWKNPPLWKKIAIVAFFPMIAFGFTYSYFHLPHHHALSWILPVSMCLIAIVVTLDIFRFSKSIWPDFINAVLFCFIAVYMTYIIMTNSHRGGLGWFWPAMMFMIAFFFAKGAYRSFSEKHSSSSRKEPQIPMETN